MKLFDKICNFCSENAPEICTYGGIVLGGIAAGGACFATVKALDVIDDFKKEIDEIHEANDLAEEISKENPVAREKYSEEDFKKDIRTSHIKFWFKMAKLYGPWVLMGVLAAASEIKGNMIYRERTLALSAEVALLKSSVSKIYERIVKKYGKEEAEAIIYGKELREIEEVVTDENGNETTVKKQVSVSHIDGCSPYAVYFNESDFYTDDNDTNVWYIHNAEERCRQKYKAKGISFLSLKEAYEQLGIHMDGKDARSLWLKMAMMRVGWIKNEGNPDNNDVIFKIIKTYRERPDGELEPAIIVDLNVDGDMFEICKEEYEKRLAIEAKEAV